MAEGLTENAPRSRVGHIEGRSPLIDLPVRRLTMKMWPRRLVCLTTSSRRRENSGSDAPITSVFYAPYENNRIRTVSCNDGDLEE